MKTRLFRQSVFATVILCSIAIVGHAQSAFKAGFARRDLTPREAVAEGGYGADNQVAPVAVGAGEQLMNTALVWIYQMLGKIK